MRRASPLSEERCADSAFTLGQPAGIGCCHTVARAPDAHVRLPGTFCVLDIAHANWNGTTLFMYVEGRKPDGVTWTVAEESRESVRTGLVR